MFSHIHHFIRIEIESYNSIIAFRFLGFFLYRKANAIFMDTRTHLKTAEYETEADTFAIELLLPDDTFSEYLSAGYTSEQISRITGYAQRLIDLKASHIKIL